MTRPSSTLLHHSFLIERYFCYQMEWSDQVGCFEPLHWWLTRLPCWYRHFLLLIFMLQYRLARLSHCWWDCYLLITQFYDLNPPFVWRIHQHEEVVPDLPTYLWPWWFSIAFTRFFMGKGRRLKWFHHVFIYTGLLLPDHIVAELPGAIGESNLSTPDVAPTGYLL